MTERLNLWLSQHARLHGVLACGLRYPAGTTFTQSFAAEFSTEALETACRCVADTVQVLQMNRLPTEQLRWLFERALLEGGRRPDGVCLVVVTARDAHTDLEGVERLFQEFQSLP